MYGISDCMDDMLDYNDVCCCGPDPDNLSPEVSPSLYGYADFATAFRSDPCVSCNDPVPVPTREYDASDFCNRCRPWRDVYFAHADLLICKSEEEVNAMGGAYTYCAYCGVNSTRCVCLFSQDDSTESDWLEQLTEGSPAKVVRMAPMNIRRWGRPSYAFAS